MYVCIETDEKESVSRTNQVIANEAYTKKEKEKIPDFPILNLLPIGSINRKLIYLGYLFTITPITLNTILKYDFCFLIVPNEFDHRNVGNLVFSKVIIKLVEPIFMQVECAKFPEFSYFLRQLFQNCTHA